MTAPDAAPNAPSSAAAEEAPRRRWDRAVVTEFVWRAAVFLAALAILVIVTTRWNRWQGGARWQVTDDAYLQADLTPLSANWNSAFMGGLIYSCGSRRFTIAARSPTRSTPPPSRTCCLRPRLALS